MKRSTAKNTAEILQKIENIEKEVMGLKLTLLKNLPPSGKKLISLKGILKGIEVTEEDISSAKKSLYSKIGA
jgi:hypothetical protein